MGPPLRPRPSSCSTPTRTSSTARSGTSLVREALAAEYSELVAPYQVQNLPLAVERRKDNPELVHWSGTDTVFGPLADGPLDREPFILREQHRCNRSCRRRDGTRVEYAEVQNLARVGDAAHQGQDLRRRCNAYLTPQLLWASGIRPEPLGRYLTEQPMAFCQIVLRQEIVDGIARDHRFRDKRRRATASAAPDDPVPDPRGRPGAAGLDPGVGGAARGTARSTATPSTTATYRPNVDSRLVVDLRWFGIVEPRYEDPHDASRTVTSDVFGMPQPTFEWVLHRGRPAQAAPHDGATCCARPNALGGFLPGSEPQFVAPGLPVHVTGTTRMGTDAKDSVVDEHSRVWGIDNLYLGGNGLIPRGCAAIPR